MTEVSLSHALRFPTCRAMCVTSSCTSERLQFDELIRYSLANIVNGRLMGFIGSVPGSQSITSGGVAFNQYLVVDKLPLLFHIGLRKITTLVHATVAKMIPSTHARLERLSVCSPVCPGLHARQPAAWQCVPTDARLVEILSSSVQLFVLNL
jgi:hypothetical protein